MITAKMVCGSQSTGQTVKEILINPDLILYVFPMDEGLAKTSIHLSSGTNLTIYSPDPIKWWEGAIDQHEINKSIVLADRHWLCRIV